MSKADAIIDGILKYVPLTKKDYEKIEVFHENAEKLVKAVNEGDIPIVELEDQRTREIVQEFRKIVDEKVDRLQSEFQKVVMDNQKFLTQLMEKNQPMNTQLLPPAPTPLQIPASMPPPLPPSDNVPEKGVSETAVKKPLVGHIKSWSR